MHPVALGIRVGPIFGGLGSVLTQNMGGATLESTVGLELRPAVQFPMVRLPDGRSVLQGEVFGAIAFYGSSDKFMVQATGAKVTPGAKLLAAGFAARGNLHISSRLPLVIAPAVGFAIGTQLYTLSTSDGACDVSASLPTVAINIDLALRLELGGHHAFYFSPANLFVVPPTLTDGEGVDLSCVGLATDAKPAQAFGTDSTQFNYSLDLGYMFQF
jgi:hypothetical protein